MRASVVRISAGVGGLVLTASGMVAATAVPGSAAAATDAHHTTHTTHSVPLPGGQTVQAASVVGPSVPTDAGAFVPLPPVRILDTRANGHVGQTPAGQVPVGQVSSSAPLDLEVQGQGGVPTGAGVVSAVVLNVTVIGPNNPGWLTAYPGGSTTPTASNLNFYPNETIPNLVTVPVNQTTGDINLALGGYPDPSVSADIAVDVSGYYVGGTPTAAGTFTAAATPTRILDTRADHHVGQTPGGAVPVAQTDSTAPLDLQVVGQGGVPASATSVVMNVTVVGPSDDGWLTAYPGGAATPTASNLNFYRGETIPNLVTVKVGAGGDVDLALATYPNPSVSADLVVDVAGWYSGGNGTDPGTYKALASPERLFDTRSQTQPQTQVNINQGQPIDNVVPTGGGSPDWDVPAMGVAGGLPDVLNNAAAVVMNNTVVNPSDTGWETVYPADLAQAPNASNVNFSGGETIANLGITKLSGDGWLALHLGSYPAPNINSDVVGDIAGYFIGPTWHFGSAQVASTAAGNQYPIPRGSLSCASISFCVAGGANTVSVYNGSSWTTPTTPFPGGNQAQVGVSCASASFCVATQGGTSSTFNGSSWSTPVTTGLGFDSTALSCPVVNFCMLISVDGGSVGLSYATFNGSSWLVGGPTTGGTSPAAISCTSANFCMESADGVRTWNGQTWSSATGLQRSGGGSDFINSISCVSSSECAAVGGPSPYGSANSDLWVWSSSAPNSWSGPYDTGHVLVNGLSCSGAALCAMVDQSGDFIPSNAPVVQGVSNASLGAVSCPTQTFCMTLDSNGMAREGRYY